ncbi:hypothetical protein PMAYCL1PPCAC_20373, partial [Pristionchus mayeri]
MTSSDEWMGRRRVGEQGGKALLLLLIGAIDHLSILILVQLDVVSVGEILDIIVVREATTGVCHHRWLRGCGSSSSHQIGRASSRRHNVRLADGARLDHVRTLKQDSIRALAPVIISEWLRVLLFLFV